MKKETDSVQKNEFRLGNKSPQQEFHPLKETKDNKQRPYALSLDAVVLECRDVHALAAFYTQMLGWEQHYTEEGEWVDLRHPDGGVKIAFQRNPYFKAPAWPEEAERLQAHLDFTVNNPSQLREMVSHALSCGAVLAKVQYGKGNTPEEDKYITLLDPEGHPFCFVIW